MGMDITNRTIANEQNYLFHTYNRPDFVIERGEGVYLYDTDGQQYLDFFAGIGVNGLGYGDAEVVQTLTDQASRLIHISNLYHTIPGGELAKLLVEQSAGLDRAFFCNSGAEAVEGSLKIARKFAREHHGEGKTTIVAFDGSFHGRTMGAVAVTARKKYRHPFMPVMPGVRFAPFNDLDALEQAMTDDVCAVIVEPVQGEGGLNVASIPFLQRIRTLCNAHNALLILDEIQCGMGRTGTLWAHEPYRIVADIMVVAKPLASGLPIGAILASQRVADVIKPGDHGTTFGGGPLVTAVAQVVLRRISDPAFLERVHQVSSYFDESLHDLADSHADHIIELRGRGLMRGLQLRGSAAELRSTVQQAGLLVATAGEDVVRMLPPLILEERHIDEAMSKLRQSMDTRQERIRP